MHLPMTHTSKPFQTSAHICHRAAGPSAVQQLELQNTLNSVVKDQNMSSFILGPSICWLYNIKTSYIMQGPFTRAVI